MLIRKLCSVCFSLCLFSFLLYGALSHAYFLMLLCFIDCMFKWSFALLYDHCSHFCMTVLVYDQVAHMFHTMFSWSHFTCYIILVLLLLTLPWGSNVFCASVSGYSIYIPCSSQLLWFMIGGGRAWSKGEYWCWRAGAAYILCFFLLLSYVLDYFQYFVLYPCFVA